MIASSLFHFTREINTLKMILSGFKFRASYNIESIAEFGFQKKFIGIPMVCFCDIPLKFIKSHAQKYGTYGIGLSKEWAIQKKINPLQYLVDKSLISRAYEILVRETKIEASNLKDLPVETLYKEGSSISIIKDQILWLTAFTKLHHNSSTQESFYSEREWRFVPAESALVFQDQDDKPIRDQLNNDYVQHRPDYLEFLIDDIQHIIVPSPSEIVAIIDVIDSLALSQDMKYALIQKVSDLDTIQKDF